MGFIHRITEQVSAESNEDTWLSLSTSLDFQDANVSREGKMLYSTQYSTQSEWK